jgi:hypothetical protein
LAVSCSGACAVAVLVEITHNPSAKGGREGV